HNEVVEGIACLLCSRSSVIGGDQWWIVSVRQALGCKNSPSRELMHRRSNYTESNHCFPLSPSGLSIKSAGQEQTMTQVRHMWSRSKRPRGQLSVFAELLHRPTNARPSTSPITCACVCPGSHVCP